MAKSAEVKAIEKQQKEQKRLAKQEARRTTASAIVMGQPMVSGMRIMDETSEELLKIFINLYSGNENENNYVKGGYDAIPDRIADSFSLEIEKLSMYGMISSPYVYSGGWEMYITPQGLHYFENKEKVQSTDNQSKASDRVMKQYDMFLSHATKDKIDYVDELYTSFRKLGINIFYDTDSISWGDKWKDAILNGTACSEFAVIVISKNFFGREWAERELKEFLQRQNDSGQKIVLPLLHGVTIEELENEYPEVADIQAIDTDGYSKDDIVVYFAKEFIKRLKQTN